MKFGSLFSGIGGFDLGFERAGLSCQWQVEIDDKARAVLDRHWPHVEKHTDVRAVGRHNLESVDLICGGFPCQDLSVAGKRAGLAGERSGLWFEFHRILAELGPQWVVIENVPGLLSSNGGRDFAAVLRGLVELGYGVGWRVLDAQYFGVAQRRRRVFIVGSLGDGRAAEILFERDGGQGDTPPRREAGQGVARSLTNSTGGASAKEQQYSFVSGDGEPLNALAFESRYARNGRGAPSELVPPLKAESGQTGKGHGAPLVFALTERGREDGRNLEWQEDIAYSLNNPGEGGRSQERLIAAPFAFDTAQITSNVNRTRVGPELPVAHTLRADPRGKPGAGGHDASEDGTGRGVPLATVYSLQTANSNMQGPIHKEELAWTVEPHPSQTRHAVGGSMGVRRLTPVECERLQGFPDHWTAGQTDSARYRQLGNAVCVNVAAWLGRRIMEHAQ